MICLDLDKQYCKRALEAAIASLNRSLNKNVNPAMKQLIEQDITIYRKGIDTITEQKTK